MNHCIAQFYNKTFSKEINPVATPLSRANDSEKFQESIVTYAVFLQRRASIKCQKGTVHDSSCDHRPLKKKFIFLAHSVKLEVNILGQ